MFSRGTSFFGATFSSRANFGGATFSGVADFGGATFSSVADFDGATFSDVASFSKATFGSTTNFVNAEMNGETFFEDVAFKSEPPRFYGAKLHHGTIRRGITWPPVPKDKREAGRFIDAYACLKREMDRLKKHEDELDFFPLELQSRRVLQESVLKGSGLPIALYGLVSDYGRSYAWPLYWLAATIAAAAWAFRECGSLSIVDAYGLSSANALGIFGFHNYFADPIVKKLPALLKILAGLQTLLGTILLFLFGLGVRNKFRMK